MTRWEWYDRVLSASGPDSPTVRLVLVVLLLKYYSDAKGYAFPGAETLAERTGQCERTVRAALESAERVGWLRIDAMPGHVSHYYFRVPESTEHDIRFDTPEKRSGVERKADPGGPEALADDLRRDLKSPSQKAGKPPSCPLCSAPMREERSRRTKEPMFWGCTRYRTAGCRGRINFGEEPDPAREAAIAAERASAAHEREAQEKADNEAAIARNRAKADELRARLAKPVTDATTMAEAALSGALRYAPTSARGGRPKETA